MPVAECVAGAQRQKERRAEPARRSFAFYGPQGLRSSEAPPKKVWIQNQNPLGAASPPAEGHRRCFLRSQPRRRLGLGHPLGRDPSRTTPSYHGPSGPHLKQDISTLLGIGHFYFALTQDYIAVQPV